MLQQAHVLAATANEVIGRNGPLDPHQAAQLRDHLRAALDSARLLSEQGSLEGSEPLTQSLYHPESSLFSSNDTQGPAFSRSLEVPYGVNLDRVSLKWHSFSQPFGGSDAGPEGGFRPLVEKVLEDARGHGAQAILSCEVLGVEQTDFGVRVHTQDKTYIARTVVVTIPLGVLKHVVSTLFVPSLSPRRLAVIARTHVGVLEKLAISYPSAWWPKSSTVGSFTFLPRTSHIDVGKTYGNQEEEVKAALDTCTISVASFAAPTLPRTHPTLLFYLSPTPAGNLAHIPDDALAQGAHAFLCDRWEVSPEEAPPPQGIARTEWAADRFSRGATSTPVLVGDGRSPLDSVELGKSVWDGRLGFAGEHTDLDNRGSVAGAIISGKREADRVKRLLRQAKENHTKGEE
jgi:hypothetical protein